MLAGLGLECLDDQGVEWIGDGMASARMWTRPAASVLAIDATPVRDASNTLIPTARAKVSVRIAPGDDADSATEALVRHLRAHAPWGARVEVEPGQGGAGSAFPVEGPFAEPVLAAIREAFGVDAVQIGVGGSIPIAAEFADRNPGALVVLTAVVDPTSRMHGIDESVDLSDLASATLAEAVDWLHGVLAELGDKTLLDALVPAIDTLEQQVAAGAPAAEAVADLGWRIVWLQLYTSTVSLCLASRESPLMSLPLNST
mgnify:CR=1 FL=1